ncbi:G patch domain-containing protein 4 isoform X2 [Phlebotomus argentipes]|uniref:G patch domain-containing protein 4 isoform X2 n=1 Tax=Phlebotomus argentipes TaxID=94469 RepID=UPI002892EEB5|nr:G patch domain-containing protein 4 isoform X2 [Phlebotomus argentipes]
MDFGQSILQKYGWSEGQGLGKHNSGIAKPLKANLKFDTSGLGHDGAAEYKDQWWEKAYNSAASNLAVRTDGEAVKMELRDGQSVKISTTGFARPRDPKSSKYGNFVRCATLTSEGREDRIEEETDTSTDCAPLARPLTDDELFRACGGRTAHKGARHGLTLSGKLARLAEQDNLLLHKMGEDRDATESEWQRKVNKKKKRRPIAAPTPHGSPEAVAEEQDLVQHSLEMSEAAALREKEDLATRHSLTGVSPKSHRIQRKHKKKRSEPDFREHLLSEMRSDATEERRSRKKGKRRREADVEANLESSNSADAFADEGRGHKRLRAADEHVFETSTGIQVELDDPAPSRRQERRCPTKKSTKRNIRQITDRFARALTTREPSDDEGIDP